MPRERVFRIIERTAVKDGKKITRIYARTSYKGRDGRRHTLWRSGDTRTEAKERLKEALEEVETHGEEVVKRSRSTFNELADYMKENYLVEAVYARDVKVAGMRSWQKARSLLKPLRGHFGPMRLRDITYGDIARYKRKRLETPTDRKRDEKGNPVGERSICSVHRELALLRKSLNVAVRERWIVTNPFGQGDPLITEADEVQRERIFGYDEEENMLAAAEADERRAHLRAMLICLIETGLRRGQMVGIRRSHVDLKGRQITTHSYKGKRKITYTVPVTDRLYDELVKLFEHLPPGEDPLIFGSLEDIKRSWRTVRRLTGLDDVRLHDIRHVAATRMIRGGLNIAEVGKVLGHRQPKTTWRYINVDQETVGRAAEGLNALRAKESDEEEGKPAN